MCSMCSMRSMHSMHGGFLCVGGFILNIRPHCDSLVEAHRTHRSGWDLTIIESVVVTEYLAQWYQFYVFYVLQQ
jgi:hypothetical protein